MFLDSRKNARRMQKGLLACAFLTSVNRHAQKSGKPFSGLPLSDFSEKVLYTILLIPEDISWQGV